jgi:hypothetical protein
MLWHKKFIKIFFQNELRTGMGGKKRQIQLRGDKSELLFFGGNVGMAVMCARLKGEKLAGNFMSLHKELIFHYGKNLH